LSMLRSCVGREGGRSPEQITRLAPMLIQEPELLIHELLQFSRRGILSSKLDFRISRTKS